MPTLLSEAYNTHSFFKYLFVAYSVCAEQQAIHLWITIRFLRKTAQVVPVCSSGLLNSTECFYKLIRVMPNIEHCKTSLDSAGYLISNYGNREIVKVLCMPGFVFVRSSSDII